MSDLISREMTIDTLRDKAPDQEGVDDLIAIIKEIPSVKPQEPKTGHWIKMDRNDPYWYMCSECCRRTDEETNFCPGCGARMESEVSDEM